MGIGFFMLFMFIIMVMQFWTIGQARRERDDARELAEELQELNDLLYKKLKTAHQDGFHEGVKAHSDTVDQTIEKMLQEAEIDGSLEGVW